MSQLGRFIPVEVCDTAETPVSAASAQRSRNGGQTTAGFPVMPRLTVTMPNGANGVMLTMDGGDARVVSAMIAALGVGRGPCSVWMLIFASMSTGIRLIVDFRVGINCLAAIVEQSMGLSPFQSTTHRPPDSRTT